MDRNDYIRNDIIDVFLKGRNNTSYLLMEAGHAVEDDPCYGMDDNAGEEREQEEFAREVVEEVMEVIRTLKKGPPCQHEWDHRYRHGNRDDLVIKCRKCGKRSVEEEERVDALNAAVGAYI